MESVVGWIRGAGLLAAVVFAWELFVPENAFWSVLAAASLVGGGIAMAAVARQRRRVHALVAVSLQARPQRRFGAYGRRVGG